MEGFTGRLNNENSVGVDIRRMVPSTLPLDPIEREIRQVRDADYQPSSALTH